MLKKTPLNNQHSNAKLVNFGGWEMPLHYGSQIEEHHKVREDAGIFDVSHMTIIDLTGEKVTEFLRYLLANDVGRLNTIGKAIYSCMLNENGGVIDDLIVYYQSNEQFRMVVNSSTKNKDIAWIKLHAKRFAVQLKERDDLAMIAIQGPKVMEKVKNLLPANALALKPFHAVWDEWFIARTGYTGENGFEVMLPANQAPSLWENLLSNDIHPIGLGARDTLRLEAGMNLYGTDMDEDCSPFEAGLSWTVAMNPQDRDFIGRKALQTQKDLANHRIMIALVLQDKGILRDHQPIYTNNGEGYITSGSFSPTLGKSIAFARVPMGKYEQVTVRIRNKTLSAKVIKPPFVRNGKIKVDVR
ncbi:glycine cleavage system aminomethyltransferase GcvT [Candidatus Halobeggiatoa sp. HSG11]|nr:glycine cleavage system aminomethyltransferase GcvT [Candidatus Halobeggiatoa sp. HSG11]